ncbi:MAG: PQQ-dependent sugar dehydrogenase [Pseudomonadota bacterium]
MINSRAILGLFSTLGLIIAGCGGGGGGGGGGGNLNPPNPPPPPPSSTVSTQQVFAGVTLSAPVGMVQAPGDNTRWFAIEQTGVVVVFDNDDANATRDVFVNITGRVAAGGEMGLLGIAFHPDFATNGEVFLSYTAPGMISTISRFTSFDGGLTLDPASEEIILTVPQDQGNHNGGGIAFGPDGFLYIGFGDGGGGGDPLERAESTTNVLGAFLRIDIDIAVGYQIPPGNPFAGNALCVGGFGSGNCPEIFAWGFRNPWRWSFDMQTGQLWVGDVGQGSWEEVDRVDVGENYGWDIREGAHCHEPSTGCSTNGLTDPVTEYPNGADISITGGYVYRGTAVPDQVGNFIFGDFGSGRVWSVAADAPIGTDPTEIADTNFSISSFAQDADGEVYIVDIGGSVHQIVP